MLERVWAKMSGREKLIAYAAGIMVAGHLVGLTMSNGYYSGDFADGGTLGMLAILAAIVALGAVAAHRWPSGAVSLPASYGHIILAAGAVAVIIGLVLFAQVSAANSETIAFFGALHPTAAAAEIPSAAFLGVGSLIVGGLMILYVGWRENAAAKPPVQDQPRH
jgi:uncharacterized membrane protein